MKGGKTTETRALFCLIKGRSSQACWCDPKPVAAKSVPPFWKIFAKLLSLHQNENVDNCPKVDPRVATISIWPQLPFFHAVYIPAPSHVHVRILFGKGETCSLQDDLLLICLALQSVIRQLLALSSYTLVVFLTCCLSFPQCIIVYYKDCCFFWVMSSQLTEQCLTSDACIMCLGSACEVNFKDLLSWDELEVLLPIP